MAKMYYGPRSRRRRTYRTSNVRPFFHNFEHDPLGRTHCQSAGKYPYTIEHSEGKHVISAPIARGHGTGGKEQWFEFPKKKGQGYELESGVPTQSPIKRARDTKGRKSGGKKA